jgi:hypothetical protein
VKLTLICTYLIVELKSRAATGGSGPEKKKLARENAQKNAMRQNVCKLFDATVFGKEMYRNCLQHGDEDGLLRGMCKSSRTNSRSRIRVTSEKLSVLVKCPVEENAPKTCELFACTRRFASPVRRAQAGQV